MACDDQSDVLKQEAFIVIYTDDKYENMRHAPLLGSRIVTVNRVRGTKKYVVIVEPSMGCDGKPTVEEFGGRWAEKQALTEFRAYTETDR